MEAYMIYVNVTCKPSSMKGENFMSLGKDFHNRMQEPEAVLYLKKCERLWKEKGHEEPKQRKEVFGIDQDYYPRDYIAKVSDLSESGLPMICKLSEGNMAQARVNDRASIILPNGQIIYQGKKPLNTEASEIIDSSRTLRRQFEETVKTGNFTPKQSEVRFLVDKVNAILLYQGIAYVAKYGGEYYNPITLYYRWLLQHTDYCQQIQGVCVVNLIKGMEFN